MTRPLVLLATSRDWADGEPAHEALEAALEARGVAWRWAVWDDPAVDWRSARAVAVRSTWDYTGRLAAFLGWASDVGPTLVHGADVFRWNTDKSYLVDLQEAGLPVVPTSLADDPAELRKAVARCRPAVVKPRVGAGGRGLAVVREVRGWTPDDDGPWVVQPLVPSVHSEDEGETSVFVFAGRPVSQVRKVAGPDDVRVHPWHGGTERRVELMPEAAALAVEAMGVAGGLLGADLVYGRVDLMRHEGELVVSEIEITEPGLYLDVVPENAAPFADAIACRL